MFLTIFPWNNCSLAFLMTERVIYSYSRLENVDAESNILLTNLKFIVIELNHVVLMTALYVNVFEFTIHS